MSSLSALYGRVPTLAASQVQLSNMTRTNADLLRLNEQLLTGRRVNRPSEDPVAAAVVGGLDRKLERDDQIDRNMSHASAVFNEMDSTMSQISTLLNDLNALGLDAMDSGTDQAGRKAMAGVVDQQLTALLSMVNREHAGLHYFAGSKTEKAPVESFWGGYRYLGDLEGMFTDMGSEIDFPITLGADTALGAVSGRVEGDVDLDPALTDRTLIRDLRGVAQGRELGSLDVQISTLANPVTIDLSHAETIGDVRDAIESGIRAAEPTAFAGAWGTGVQLTGDRLMLDLAVGVTVSFDDGPVGQTAQALGLQGTNYTNATQTNPVASAELDPRVTERTLLGDMSATMVYGDIVITNGGRSGTLTTAAGMSIGALKEAVERLDLGVRVEIHENGDSLSFVNEVSGMNMSISDAGTGTATSLGVRTLMGRTPISVFNDGRGVEIANGEIDPTTGLPDADRNTDFRVTLSDGTTAFDVDLRPEDMVDVDSLLARINAESGGAGGFTATVDAATNAIVFADTAGGPNAVSVSSLNGYAAEDLGLLDGTGAAGTYSSSDRATVRVSSLFSTMVDLRNALNADDRRALGVAAAKIEEDVDRLTEARGLVGTRAQRVEESQSRMMETRVVDERIRSELRDLDFTKASTELNALSTQLQAGYQVAARLQPLSLMNFLS